MCLVVSSLSFSQTPEYKDYTVTKGDTLWDISNNELKDPFLWPKVWKENPEIKNPDLIYPGQKIRIPLYLLQKEIKPEVKPEIKQEVKPEVRIEPKPEPLPPKPVQATVKPAKKEPLVNRHVLLASGYIDDAIHSIGTITDSPMNKYIIGTGDYAYVKTAGPVQKGDKFYIIRPFGKVVHPKTGDKLGYLIGVIGIAEVVDNNNDTKIIVKDDYIEVSPGDYLDTYYEIEPPHAPDIPRKPNIDGYVVVAKELHIANGTWDIVYLDRGAKDGLEVGDVLATMLQSNHKIINGFVQIINVRQATSTAIVRKVDIEITAGDGVAGAGP
jgi:LysM repeat protein